ncbi:uroporphyrinogen decarboxylase family protein [Thermodesulfobacteriota bacterium]
MDKTQEMLERWCLAPDVTFKSAEAEEAYKKRARRIADVVQLKTPDRVPITPSFGMFPALDNGYTCEDVFFDPKKSYTACMKTLAEFEPDTFRVRTQTGDAWEALDCRQLILPGRGISPNSGMQYVESEYATEEEFYDAFLEDPTDFMLRVHLPRVYGILEPLKDLPPIRDAYGYYTGLSGVLRAFGRPEISGAFEKLSKAGAELMKWADFSREKSMQVLAMGFPTDFGGGSHAPFDMIGDFIRGTRGIMLDMFRCPDKLIAAMERVVPMLIKMGLNAKKTGNPFVSIPLHKGPEGFMSLEQYKTFYWPTLRKVMVGLIDEGLVPMPFFEGDNTSRLEIIKDIPKGKAAYRFESVDIYRAKEILGDTVCFRGNVPISLINTGTPEQIKAYVKELIDVVGKDGGLMVDSGSVIDEGKHENVRMMIEHTKEYGRYE